MVPQQSRRASWVTRFLTRRLPFLARWQASLGAAFPRRKLRTWLVSALLLLTIFMGPNGVLTNLPAVHAAVSTAFSKGKPNRFTPTQDASSVTHPNASLPPDGKGGTPAPIVRNVPLPMQPGRIVLTPGKTGTFLSSDGRFEVDVPGGATTAADQMAAQGTLVLQITQIAPASGSSAGGSGRISFGTYLLQLVDAQGRRARQQMHAQLTVKLHYGTSDRALDLAHGYVVLNGSLPAGVKLAPSTSSTAATLDAQATLPTTLNTQQQTLAATVPFGVLASSVSFGTDAPVATFGKPDPFNVGLSTGALSFTEPIDVPSGPGGLTPPVTLSYSSAGVSEDHGVQSAAPWVGEGWSFAMGSISWAEHLVSSGNWDDSWQLSDPYGTAAQLIPPTSTTSTFNDDTGHSIAGPTVWHTAPESYVKVVSYPGTISLGGTTAPCFRVFLQNGLMEEFGCTPDSLQYYLQPSGANQGKYYISSWLLDLVTDPEGNQIHFTYTSDTETGTGGKTYPRDTELSTIAWDSPNCHNAQTACAGSSWAPLFRVNLLSAHGPTRQTLLQPGVCNPGSNLRCDDPLDLSGSGGLAAPQVQSTLVLNDIQVQVNTGGAWNTLRDYQLSYEQSGPSTITDPSSDTQESVAGILDLTQIAEVGDDNATLAPIRTFGYTNVTEYYEDSAFTAPAGDCGPSWNDSRCELWSQSYGGNSRYLASASNGQGLYQTFSWANGRNNTHGVDTGGNNADPLYCNAHQTGTRCSEADDQNWSNAVLTQETDTVVRLSQNGQGGPQTNTPVTSLTTYSYQLTTPLAAQACSDCVAGMYWGDQNDNDYLDYYNGTLMGFAQATVTNPDGSVDVHKFDATLGWGLYDTSQVHCYETYPCHNDPWWSLTNAAHGHEYELDQYDTDGTTLLSKTLMQYTLVCPPGGVSGTPPNGYGNWGGNLVSELDPGNPVADCAVQTTQVQTITADGSSNSGNPDQTVTYAYDSYGRVTSQTISSNDGGATGSPTTIVTTTAFVWNDNVNVSTGQGTYLIAFPAFTDTEDSAGNRYSCTYTSYDGQSWAENQQTNLTAGLPTETDAYTNCGTKANNFTDQSGLIKTTATYDQFGNPLTTDDADANAGIGGHAGCTVGSTQYSTCTAYDTTFDVLPVSSANALNQTASLDYTQTAAGGFGLWPTSTTDVNGQTTTVTYDGLGRQTSQTLPGETNGETTTSTSYTEWCVPGSAQAPCVEVDTTQRLTSTTTVTSRAFYDGYGNLVETRSPGPNGEDVVQYHYYDPEGRDIFDSLSYFVTAYTGAPGPSAYSIPDSTQNIGTTTAYTNLRTTTVTDALSDVSTSTLSVVCGAQGADSACYVQVLSVDPLNHASATLTDALGRETYDLALTGTTAPYPVYTSTQYTYDYLGDQTQILLNDLNGHTSQTTFLYDMVGRQTGMTDPDRGTESYVYDPDGNILQTTDARGSAGTIYAGYDGLDRQLWRNTTNSPTGAYVTYSYDSTANGNYGVGHPTGETFTGGPNQSLSGSYSYIYDVRGQETQATMTIGGTPYTSQSSYDDAGDILSQTYPNGDVLTTSYTPQGWMAGLTLQQGSTQTTLLSNLNYTSSSGAAGLPSSASLNGGTYTRSASYDLLLRLTDAKVTRSSDQTTLFEEGLSYDSASRVTGITTTLAQGTDVQQFCYDDQNRLTWAGSVGTPPCSNTAITPGSLTSAQYTQSYTYDTFGRLTSGPSGSYTYGDSHHLNAVTATGAGYTASYDAAGNMICRAPTSATTCIGSQPTGAQLSYDNEGRLVAWQNAPSNPSSTEVDLYDGEGHRVEHQTTQGGTTTTTVYVGDLEEITTTGSSTTTTTYYQGVALAVNGVLSYQVSDALGSLTEALDLSGNVEASQFYTPYGTSRYSSGTMPGSYGFTGQRSDNSTGLNYDNARYYDPVVGAFTSADTVLAGLNRYSYVGGNPENFTDPSGHMGVGEDGEGDGQGGYGPDGGWAGSGPSIMDKTISKIAQGIDGLVAGLIGLVSGQGSTSADPGVPDPNAAWELQYRDALQWAKIPHAHWTGANSTADLPSSGSSSTPKSTPHPAPGGSFGGGLPPPPAASPPSDCRDRASGSPQPGSLGANRQQFVFDNLANLIGAANAAGAKQNQECQDNSGKWRDADILTSNSWIEVGGPGKFFTDGVLNPAKIAKFLSEFGMKLTAAAGNGIANVFFAFDTTGGASIPQVVLDWLAQRNVPVIYFSLPPP